MGYFGLVGIPKTNQALEPLKKEDFMGLLLLFYSDILQPGGGVRDMQEAETIRAERENSVKK